VTRRLFLRPPTVAEYARMTQAARLEAVEALEAARLTKRTGPPPRTCHDHTPEETRMLAHVLLPIVAKRWPAPPHVQADRRQSAQAEANGWTDKRRAP
jgi:hypothetical protein